MQEQSKPERVNRLAQESSPYLLQHKHNPVDWYPWGAEALAAAREQDKPIFLSIGYSTCHWCHVMERESFENEETARLLNDSFISIKVDREERPDIDEIYMQAAQILTGAGGWPLSVFLDGDLKPFYAGTYFPPLDAYGRPGFPRLLKALAQAYRERRAEVERSSSDLASAVRQSLSGLNRNAEIDWTAIARAADHLLADLDPEHGGFGPAPKFPPSFGVRLLMREYDRRGGERELEAVTLTLRKMQRGGIFDQVGGGFHRYSTDSEWLVPHFEKMLYDNALLVQALVETYQVTGDKEYLTTAKRTLDFILREMTSPGGGFFSAIDADSEGEEGKYYVWRPEEVIAALGDLAADLFNRVYGITEAGKFEHKTSIPHLKVPIKEWAVSEGRSPAEVEENLAAARSRLLQAREERIRPGLDNKIVVSWNGLMISAMASAGRAMREEVYITAAQRAARFLLGASSKGHLPHTVTDGAAQGAAYQDDYACLINGLIDLHQADFNSGWLKKAERLANEMIEKFWDGEQGGFFLTTESHATPIVRSKNPTDGVTPSGNSAAALALGRLARLLGRDDFWSIAMDTVRAFGEAASRAPRAFEHLLIAAHFLLSPPTEVVIAGDPASDEVETLSAALSSMFLPNTVCAGSFGQGDLPLTRGKEADGRAAAFVCRDYACHAPVHTSEQLKEALRSGLRS